MHPEDPNKNPPNPAEDVQSCAGKMSRKEFLAKVLGKATAAGAVISGMNIAPKIVDKFIVPPAYADSSGGPGGGFTQPGDDTTMFSKM